MSSELRNFPIRGHLHKRPHYRFSGTLAGRAVLDIDFIFDSLVSYIGLMKALHQQ